MRLPFIPPTELSAEHCPLYEDMREGISKSFHEFIAIREDGALMGPWNPWALRGALRQAHLGSH
jgi:4-carboxymuconolactone decarboxylase